MSGRKRWSGLLWVVVTGLELQGCGSPCYLSSVNVLFVIRTSGALAEEVLPSKRHQAVGKDSGKTSHIEQLNCTLRQRVSRLVRKTLSFSKELANHVGAIWYFTRLGRLVINKVNHSSQANSSGWHERLQNMRG